MIYEIPSELGIRKLIEIGGVITQYWYIPGKCASGWKPSPVQWEGPDAAMREYIAEHNLTVSPEITNEVDKMNSGRL